MRSVVIIITCDVCDEGIKEDVEGDNSIRLIVRGEHQEIDVCNECMGGSFLQEARPVKSRGKPKKSNGTFPCDACDMTFSTNRGLKMHQSLTHKKEPREA
jgi:hypothetical protein